MLEDIAQKIAMTTGDILGHKVIITDEHSIIIGSSDTSRLGNIHEASVSIIKTGKPNPDTIDISSLKGTKHGFALPIEFLDKNIGSFGITGKREEVKGYCYLLKEYIESMLYQEMYLKSQMIQEQAIEDLLQRLAMYHPGKQDERYMLMRGQELGYDLNIPRIVVVVDFGLDTEELNGVKEKHQAVQLKLQSQKQKNMRMMKDIFTHTKDMIAPFQDNHFVILPSLPSNTQEKDAINSIKEACILMVNRFKQINLSVTVGIGTTAKGIQELHHAYKAAWRALELGKRQHKSSNIHYIHDLVLEDLSSYAQNCLSYKHIEQMLDPLKEDANWKELSETIIIWCESGFNQKNAASMLFIHRNTLQYRLKKIHQITGIDPMDFKKIMILYLGILMKNAPA